ncbi:MAG: helix-turn-helix domain-containing protein [Elusimicrobiota bacterium]|jgi:transcriptional regulator with XRE-family HTH domain|nr:helix-turn-helix domain-containing protein [Elusimicrobiota bacterium]
MYEKVSGQKIKLAVKESGFTQEEFAKKMGTKHSAISRWINGGRNPKLVTLKKISELTKKPMQYFFDTSVNIGEVSDNATVNINQKDFEQLKKENELLKRELEIEKREKELSLKSKKK